MGVLHLIAGRYEVKEPLGEGGMGIVYRVIDIKTKSFVALKTMRDVTDPAAVELFAKEWGVLATLSHPNIVDIRDVGEIDDQGQKKPFFVMPLLPGVTLAKLIETGSARLTVERAVAITTQVCRGLQAAHERGLVHRDIKPSNIFVMEDDTAKIIDFGVAHLAGALSVTGQKGTWQYMSPEQVDMKPPTPVSDVFSLGVVCYEALTGRKPFARKTQEETAEAVRHHSPPPISEINSAVSQLVSMVIHKAMAKAPIHRFSSARDFGDTLQKAYLNQPIPRFDRAKIQPRIERAKKSLADGDCDFASEILNELETEGHIDVEIHVLRRQIDQALREKRIRQLLEGARTRVEQDEIPLALEKLQEVLGIDPENADAHAMRRSLETQRNDRQIESWLSLAVRHLERHDFTEARQALLEVLKIDESDPDAVELLRQTAQREKDALQIRDEKEQLYGSALSAYQHGEISTALSKLDKLFALGHQTPDAAVPERDAVYQGFYNQVRSDRDSIHNSYDEGRRQLAEKNFSRALEICDEFIVKYPADAVFQALKLEVLEQQRQELSAYIADVGRRVDAEQDLDHKSDILKEACERYPNEQQFQQALKLHRERRELVRSIVSKAQYYEEKSLFTEAIGQWDILRKIYPRYPGIEVEVEQLVKRRDQQSKEESKARLIEQIDRSLDSGDFTRARDLAARALAEYPKDQELAGLERLARQGLERCAEALELYGQARALFTERKLEAAIEGFRRAFDLDPANRVIREGLVNALVEQAKPLLDEDWRAAEPLVGQASDLDAGNPAVRGLRTEIAALKRKDSISQCLAEVRDLLARREPELALGKVTAALAEYPNEARLLQQQTNLQSLIRAKRGRLDSDGGVEAQNDLKPRVDQPMANDQTGSIFDQSQADPQNRPAQPKTGVADAEKGQSATAGQPRSGADGSIFAPPISFIRQAVRSIVHRPASVAAAQKPEIQPEPAISSQEPTRPDGLLAAVKTAADKPWSALKQPAWRGISRFQIAIVAIVVVLLSAALARTFFRKPPPPPPPPPALVRSIAVKIVTIPLDAIVKVDGNIRSGTIELPSDGTRHVEVSRLGYIAQNDDKKPAAEWRFELEAEPLHLNLSTSEKAGKIFVDDSERGELQTDPTPDFGLPADGRNHKFVLRNGKRELLSFSFTAKPGEAPQISELRPKELIVVSGLASEAVVYAGAKNLSANLAGHELQPITADGLKLTGVSGTNNVITFSDNELRNVTIDSDNSPFIYVGMNAGENAYLTVETKPETAHVFVDGVEKKPPKHIRLKPGTHSIIAKAEGYEDAHQSVELIKDKLASVPIDLKKQKEALATLAVVGGTPGAEILIDGVSTKILDNLGSATVEISPAARKVAFRKQYFEPSPEMPLQFEKGHARLDHNEAKLREFGTLQFQITPPEADVSYRRSDQGDSQTAKGHESRRVQAGTYTIRAEAPGYNPQEKPFDVSPGLPTPVALALVPKPPTNSGTGEKQEQSPFVDPTQVTKTDDGFWTNTSPADYVFLKPGISYPLILEFSNPGKKKILGSQRKVEWVVRYGGKEKVEYSYDWQKLHRKGKGREDNIPCPSSEPTAKFTISIQAHEIAVAGSGCELPPYQSADQDLSQGRIGIKGKVLFKVEFK
jgi:serine/threonine protein kinase/Tfp pilus assembly protein PilF